MLLLLGFVVNIISRYNRGVGRYCDQWIEALKPSDGGELLIGIGEIKYDNKTNEHVFVGKTFDKNGGDWKSVGKG